MKHKIRLQFDSSLENIRDINDSFSYGRLKICYHGPNRNKSKIDKQSIERAIQTLYNCPVVCNYDAEEDTIGGHDIAIVHTKGNGTRVINLTAAVGVIPSDANVWWQTVVDSGEEHEYLMADAILWKRSPAYSKIVNDGVVGQSMEITVNDGTVTQDGYFEIRDFTFTALCLLGDDVEPCFESASLQMFNREDDITQQFANMMQEFKEIFSLGTMKMDHDTFLQNNSITEGGGLLEEKLTLLGEFGLSEEELDFNIADFTVDELRTKLTAMQDIAPTGGKDFALSEQIVDSLMTALATKTYESEWGTAHQYWYVDYDATLSEVYCYDCTDDFNLYGFTFTMNGDNAVIDFETKKRKKFSIVDFDEGEQQPTFSNAGGVGNGFAQLMNEYADSYHQLQEKYDAATGTVLQLQNEISELKAFKAQHDAEQEQNKRNEILAQFTDLSTDEAFINLSEHCMEYTVEELEEKCFAIRGRNTTKKFSHEPEPQSIKLPIDTSTVAGTFNKDPYGGIFAKFGYEAE